uniref:NADH-ubiquinone oxidoreductase chain 4 n=1 Tax=Schlettererius cinctipes TaxID=32424 RepID=C4NCG3_9HYME|nr:NADH dehydrogenase subunit 4 [Schlettererius cinctipes]
MMSLLIMYLYFMIMFMYNNFNMIMYMMFQNIMFFSCIMFMLKISMMKNFFWVKLSLMFGIDKYSFGLIMLSMWIFGLSFLASLKVYKMKVYLKMFLMFIYLNFYSLVLCFCSMNMFMFYFFFEMSLILTMFLLMGWGFQPERIQASMYMLFYTLFGSLPLLFMMLYLYYMKNSMDFFYLINLFNTKNLFLFMFCLISFLIKLPMFMFHLWLPKAHVEAPISGSMILAGIMLKLGGYGIIRFMMMMPKNFYSYSFFIMMISIIGSIYLSLLCLRQIDMKMLVAYSSVVHMGMMLGGLMSMSMFGLIGGFYMMISHGLCSSGMFCLVNFLYERFSSRSILINKGMLNLFPSMTLWWFLICSSNMSFPPSLNLFSEIMLIISMLLWSNSLMILIMLICFFSSLYSLYIYSYTQHGKMNIFNMFSFKMNEVNEFLLIMLHWIPLNLIFLNLFIY